MSIDSSSIIANHMKCPLCDFISQDKYQWFNHLTFHHKADEYIDWILDMIPRAKVAEEEGI